MARIHILPKSVVERIAAGEIIERPASVVKEALENAVDAGATHIEVEIEEGGRRLIRVSDDGAGMDCDDLCLAFESHATSKISAIDDLFSVKTMGFRGEALPAIAAVARVRMISRPFDAQAGHCISLEGGAVTGMEASPSAQGTVLEISNLFFNVPVRRKFLKADSTEAGHVADAVSRVALAHPEIAFRLIHNRREILDSSQVTDLKLRIREMFGRQLADDLLETSFDDGYIKLRGLISTPAFSRSNTRQQFIFLNRRFIRDRLILHAIADAYSDYLPRGRFPVTFLYLALPPSEVDVNVHPTKIEVRFRNAGAVHQAMRSALRECLSSADLTRSMDIASVPDTSGSRPVWSGEDRCQAREAIDRHFADAQHARPQAPVSGRDRQPALPAASVQETVLPRGAVQIHDTYIVVESEEGFAVIDQHALHERILYEQMRRQIEKGPLASQRLLVPLRLELSGAELLTVESNRELLETLGFEISPFGGNAAAVYAYPSILGGADVGVVATDLIGELTAEETAKTPADRILQVLACRAAVKAGDRLCDEEVRALLEKRRLADNPFNCPHGRPAALSFSLRDLDKRFQRR